MLGPVKGMVDEMYEISGTGGRDYNPYAYSQFLWIYAVSDVDSGHTRLLPSSCSILKSRISRTEVLFWDIGSKNAMSSITTKGRQHSISTQTSHRSIQHMMHAYASQQE